MPSTTHTPQTQMLADILMYGEDAAMTFTLAQQQGWTEEQMLRAGRAMQDAVRHAKRANWDASEGALDRAYQALGGENPGTGYDFYTGQHAIQQRLG